MKKLLLILLLGLFSCNEIKRGTFVSTEKPIVILDKTWFSDKYHNCYYFHIYLNQPIKIEVTSAAWDQYHVGDTVKNVAVVIQ